MLNNQESVKQDIEDTKNRILKIIEQKKTEIENMPKVDRRKKKISGIYTFEDDLEKIEEERIKKETQKRKEDIAKLRQDMTNYRKKIRELDSLKKTLSNPAKTAEKLFENEDLKVKENYKRIVNMCVATIASDNFSKSQLIGDDKVFKYDGKNYSINYNNAKKFLSMLKSKKEIISSAEYLHKKQEYDETIEDLAKKEEQNKAYKRAYENADTKEFKIVIEKMNEISKQFQELEKNEEIARRGSIFNRAQNRIRSVLGIERAKVKVPKKILEQRNNLANTISQFMNNVKKDDKLKLALNDYATVRKATAEGCNIDIDQLANVPYIIKAYAEPRIDCIPRRTIKEFDFKCCAKRMEDIATHNIEELTQRKDELEKETEGMYSKLNQKAKKMVNIDENKKSILEYAQRYYGVGKYGKDTQDGSKDMSASAAVMILEGILGKRNISMENIFKYYADIIGKDNLAMDTVDINKAMYAKMDSLKKQLTEMTKEPKKEEQRDER